MGWGLGVKLPFHSGRVYFSDTLVQDLRGGARRGSGSPSTTPSCQISMAIRVRGGVWLAASRLISVATVLGVYQRLLVWSL